MCRVLTDLICTRVSDTTLVKVTVVESEATCCLPYMYMYGFRQGFPSGNKLMVDLN